MSSKLVTWSRKDALRRADGTDKNVTLGSEVVAIRAPAYRRNHAHSDRCVQVAPGTRGRVVAAASGNEVYRRAAKRALGTTAALRIEWEVE